MMEFLSRLCPECGEILDEEQSLCESCLSERKWKDLLSFRVDLQQLVEKYPEAAALVDRCPTVRQRCSDWSLPTSQLLTDLDDYFRPSDSCLP